jgi:ornithine carbamoyltransferase
MQCIITNEWAKSEIEQMVKQPLQLKRERTLTVEFVGENISVIIFKNDLRIKAKGSNNRHYATIGQLNNYCMI